MSCLMCEPRETAHSHFSYQLVVEPLDDPISSFLSLELNLSHHYWVGFDDSALADEPTDGHHRTLKVTSRCSGGQVLCYDHEWPSQPSYGDTGVEWLWRWPRCHLLKAPAPSPASQTRIVVPAGVDQVHLGCEGRIVLRLQQGILSNLSAALCPSTCGRGCGLSPWGVDASSEAAGSRCCYWRCCCSLFESGARPIVSLCAGGQCRAELITTRAARSPS